METIYLIFRMVRHFCQPLRFLASLSQGRLSRANFWAFYLVFVAPAVGFSLVVQFIDVGRQIERLAPASFLWLLAFMIPTMIAVMRRLNDMGRTSRWGLLQPALLLTIIPLFLQVEARYSEGYDVKLGLYGSCSRLFDIPGFSNGSSSESKSRPNTSVKEERRAKCAEERAAHKVARQENKEARRSAHNKILTVYGFIHIASLAFLTKSSQSGPNKYGSNPNEVAS